MNNKTINELFQNAKSDPDLVSAINIDDLMDAIENEKNAHLDDKTLSDIADDKYKQLKKLNLGKDELKTMFSKLSEYRYIDEIHQIHKGKHIRWIRTSSTHKKVSTYSLTTGGIVVDVKFLDTGTHIMTLTKNPKIPCIQYKFDECITFQKLSPDEQLILAAYEYIQNT